ncbi:hypothetical protein VE03_06131 [Pseudogymnoascus sp. 23342-1-I1]|nr:hypothetical protein VE03_06131 [Pseudogymnoascus sp. 23342-1-I1]
MATRIVVICKSHLMPGADNVKNALMANMTCQQLWARDFDASQDRLVTEGGYHLYNQTCSLVIDNGPVDAAEQQILQSYSPDEYRAKFGTEAYENMKRQIEEKGIARRFKDGEL